MTATSSTPDANRDRRRERFRRTTKAVLRYLGVLATGAVAVALVGALVVYSGVYDVSARSGHSGVVSSVLDTMMVRSVRAHARDIVRPEGMGVETPDALAKGAAHYDAMCRICHGAPGKESAPWELYPPAPDLVAALEEERWADREIFWIVKNGIKDTAMPAFGGSHDDEDLWTLTTLVRRLPSIAPEEYEALTWRGRANGEEDGRAHDHATGSAP